MSKNKNDKNQNIAPNIFKDITQDFTRAITINLAVDKVISRVGITAMSLATIAVMAEAFEARAPKAVNTLQPAYAHATEHAYANDHAGQGRGHEAMRREKDEIRHMSISYGTSMRSHPTAGTP